MLLISHSHFFSIFFFIICTLLFYDFFFVFLSCFCCVWHANYQVYTITRLQLHRKIVEIFSFAAVVLFFQRPQSTELIRNNNFISHALASLRVLLHLLHLVGDWSVKVRVKSVHNPYWTCASLSKLDVIEWVNSKSYEVCNSLQYSCDLINKV